MPKSPVHTLIWSTENRYYVLHTINYPPQVIMSENEDMWRIWLDTHSSFSFQGQHGHLNVHKEARPDGTDYWYIYSKSSGQTYKRYLGRSATVTLAHLEEVARAFQESLPDELQAAHIDRETSSTTTQQGSEPDEMKTTMIVMTRLSPPHLPTTLVVRERLLTALDAALSRPLSLLSASAGWGKTTLLASWAHRHPQSVAWFSLEEMDNDPVRFWTLLIEALRRCWPGIGERALALLQTSASSLALLMTGLTALLNELTEQQAEASPILLILDDYHVINEPTIHSSLAFFLEHLPPSVHLLLASRVDPELPLARLRVRGHLGEIRNTELRFTQEETLDFLTQRMGIALSETDVELLQVRTEGWIASLQLAALVLQKHADPSAYVQTLSGNQRFLLDYLREEVLANLPETVQDFLLLTSVLHRFSASLCDSITGREDSNRLLEQVERANLFLQPLDDSQQWYRYHALWAQAMQHEARLRLGVAAVRELHNKASHWYEQQQMLPEAIEAALAGEDFGRAASLIKRFIIPQSFHNAYHTLSRWLRRMPEEIMRAQPELCLQSVLALTFTTDRRSPETWNQVEQLLEWAKQGLEATQQWEQLGEALQLHADLAFFQDDIINMFVLVRQARPILSEQSLLYPDNIVLRGLEAFLAGEIEMASQLFLEGYRKLKNLKNQSAAFATSLMLGAICREKCELQKASQYYHRALAHIDEDQEIARQQLLLERGGSEPFFTSWAYYSLIQLSYECNELVSAQRSLSAALMLREKPESGVHILASCMLIQARLLHALGETTQAQEALSEWEMHTHSPWSLRVIRLCRARLQLAAGDLSAVERWVQEKDQTDLSLDDEQMQELPPLFQQEEALLLARFHIAQQQEEIALQELAFWKEKAQAQGRKRSVLEILILEAQAHLACQERRQARSSLIEALRLAQPGNYQRLFLDEGRAMEALLKTFLPELREVSLISFTQTLLRAFAEGSDVRSVDEAVPHRETSVLVEPLSEQEQRVLRLLVAGRSNPEIANALVVSVNTVKTHVQSLYRKLGVRNRVEASSVARRLSLL